MANDTNVCVFVGRIANEEGIKYTNGGTSYLRFSLAVNRRYDKKDAVSFFSMVLWGKQAESLASYLVKGKQVSVVCEAVQNRWENDKGTQSKVEFTVRNIELLAGGEKRSEQRSEPHYEQAGPEDFDDFRIPF